MKTAIIFLAILATLTGCTCNKQYRTSQVPSDPTHINQNAIIQIAKHYEAGYVEFDDQGCFWDPNQRTLVENMIRTQAGLGPGLTPQPIILVTFVHGWKDNASYNSDGVNAFSNILAQLGKNEENHKDIDNSYIPRKVIGVYAGWRGLSATLEPFKELTIWERKDTAHKVGGYGAMTKLLVDLENIQKESLHALTNLPPDAPTTELIIIGHSLGAGVVYSALSQIITERFVNSVEKGKRLKPLGDQIILLNPAFEALRHYDLNQMVTSIDTFPKDQRPVLTIFTSKGDWATHYMFPASRFFSTLFENNRPDDKGAQRTASLETAGWFEPFITHDLTYQVNISTEPSEAAFDTQTKEFKTNSTTRSKKMVANVENQRTKWEPNRVMPQMYFFADTILKPRSTFRPGDPFLIVTVDKSIMAGHTDITNPVLVNFIPEYIQFCRVGPAAPTTQPN